jgi:hypothetical protein
MDGKPSMKDISNLKISISTSLSVFKIYLTLGN